MKHVRVRSTFLLRETYIFFMLFAAAAPIFLAQSSHAVEEQTEIVNSISDNAAIHEVVIDAESDTAPQRSAPPQELNRSKPDAVRVGSGGHLANVALGLVFIVILILALGWFMRRFNQAGMFNNSAIKIVAVTPLGTRERLAVVDIAGQQLLLGITATQINTLHTFSEPVANVNSSTNSSEFGRKLLAVLQQKTTSQSPGANGEADR